MMTPSYYHNKLYLSICKPDRAIAIFVFDELD